MKDPRSVKMVRGQWAVDGYWWHCSTCGAQQWDHGKTRPAACSSCVERLHQEVASGSRP